MDEERASDHRLCRLCDAVVCESGMMNTCGICSTSVWHSMTRNSCTNILINGGMAEGFCTILIGTIGNKSLAHAFLLSILLTYLLSYMCHTCHTPVLQIVIHPRSRKPAWLCGFFRYCHTSHTYFLTLRHVRLKEI